MRRKCNYLLSCLWICWGLKIRLFTQRKKGSTPGIWLLDGDWYHSDVTFDGGANGKPAYTNFNVPDSVKDDGSYPWNHEVIPAADGTKYCYLANEAKELKDVYALPKYIKQQLDKGIKTITFTLKNSAGYTQNVADYITSAFANGDGDLYTNPTLPIGSKMST